METLRMTIRPPVGIYKHPWDGMQVFTPRAVLGETMLDAMALSYGDLELAKDVILGTFADAPAPNVPCSREDGSMNMICSDGDEVGTAPTWGMPFRVIRSIYHRDQDKEWIAALYPHMKSFLDWWLKHRTDSNGWFHCKCSWESGQDGSKRFLVAEGNPAAVSDFVRTVDVEAAMAEAFQNMVLFATVAGHTNDIEYWRGLAKRRIETTRAMYVDGWFRDFDSRNDKPIILKDYYDVMMLYPLAAGIATEEQTRAIASRFTYFAENPTFWLEWPSFMFPFTEGAWNAGLQEFIGTIVANTCSRVYARTDAREVKEIPPFESEPPEWTKFRESFPKQFRYRMPGVANEFWAIAEDNPGGCENYGWGATLPLLIVRNIIGFREFDAAQESAFRLAPALPKELLKSGEAYGITNLRFRTTKTDLEYQVDDSTRLTVKLKMRGEFKQLTVRDASGKVLASSRQANQAAVSFSAANGKVYTVAIAT
jgi:mannosylglycerate hydrolase MGH1-like protein